MNIWSTFKYVPPMSLKTLAWATLSLGTYLAAAEMRPEVGGRELAPLALALAVQMVLSVTKNMTSARFLNLLRSNSDRVTLATAFFWIVAGFTGFALLAFKASDATAAMFYILYYAAHALMLAWAATLDGALRRHLSGTWTHLEKHAEPALLLEAFSKIVIALTLFTVWVFAGPFAFALMMSFGVLALGMFTNWIIVLYALTAEEHGSNE